jgi:hypothetical protein
MDKNCKCANCLYWKTDEKGNIGECHRYAPRPADTSLVKKLDWPNTMDEDFCGEFVEGKPSAGTLGIF